jgi:hypothetical protein
VRSERPRSAVACHGERALLAHERLIELRLRNRLARFGEQPGKAMRHATQVGACDNIPFLG